MPFGSVMRDAIRAPTRSKASTGLQRAERRERPATETATCS